MEVRIRQAGSQDAGTLAEFNAAMAGETEHCQLDLPTVLAGVRAVLERPELGRYFVAEVNGEIVGQLLITYEWSDWRNATFWWIQSVYVRPDCRRAGVFRSLYRHVHDLACGTPDVCGLRLYVERENDKAQATYLGLGMRPSGHVVYEEDWTLRT